MIRWLIRRGRARQRAIDLEILWPACRDNASDLEAAKAAFMWHVKRDKAWSDLTWQDQIRVVDGLT